MTFQTHKCTLTVIAYRRLLRVADGVARRRHTKPLHLLIPPFKSGSLGAFTSVWRRLGRKRLRTRRRFKSETRYPTHTLTTLVKIYKQNPARSRATIRVRVSPFAVGKLQNVTVHAVVVPARRYHIRDTARVVGKKGSDWRRREYGSEKDGYRRSPTGEKRILSGTPTRMKDGEGKCAQERAENPMTMNGEDTKLNNT